VSKERCRLGLGAKVELRFVVCSRRSVVVRAIAAGILSFLLCYDDVNASVIDQKTIQTKEAGEGKEGRELTCQWKRCLTFIFRGLRINTPPATTPKSLVRRLSPYEGPRYFVMRESISADHGSFCRVAYPVQY
jgi:hypothetical protein